METRDKTSYTLNGYTDLYRVCLTLALSRSSPSTMINAATKAEILLFLKLNGRQLIAIFLAVLSFIFLAVSCGGDHWVSKEGAFEIQIYKGMELVK